MIEHGNRLKGSQKEDKATFIEVRKGRRGKDKITCLKFD